MDLFVWLKEELEKELLNAQHKDENVISAYTEDQNSELRLLKQDLERKEHELNESIAERETLIAELEELDKQNQEATQVTNIQIICWISKAYVYICVCLSFKLIFAHR